MTIERTVGFVDLAGFTALTEVHGDDAAVDLIDALTDAADDACRKAGAQLVKTIGDAVMIAAPTPAAGFDAVRIIFDQAYELDGFPEPRAGLHHGPVIERDGDFFGATVNLAARVASRAASGQGLITEPIVSAAAEAEVDVVPLGPQQLRNVLDPVDLYAVELCGTHIDVAVDPVCRMQLSCQATVARVNHAGIEHRFCSLGCVAAFATDPDRYLPGASA